MFTVYIFESVDNAGIAFLFSPRSRPEVFCKKGVLENFVKLTGIYLYQSKNSTKFTGKHLCQGFL